MVTAKLSYLKKSLNDRIKEEENASRASGNNNSPTSLNEESSKESLKLLLHVKMGIDNSPSKD